MKHVVDSMSFSDPDGHNELNGTDTDAPTIVGPPFSIPGYRIKSMLGIGAMGQVYLATQEALERLVAVKIILPAFIANDAFRQRFLKEGKIIARLRHPHIVTIYDVGECQGYYYMIMEYVERGSLKDRIDKGFSAREAITVLRQIASALGEAHRQGFVHRDIKPANILFREDGKAVLSDFGIAKALEDNAHLTATGLAMGTLLYMSPEQVHGKAADGRSDLYSLGLVFFEMLTGHRPDHTGDGRIERLPASLAVYQGIVDKLLAMNPQDRFSNAEQVIAALKEIGQENNPTPAIAFFRRSGKKLKHLLSRPFQALGVLLLIIALGGGLSYTLWEYRLPSPLAIQVAYSYKSPDERDFQSLVDGDLLYSGDHYRIHFTAKEDGYVYIFQIDSSGAVYRLFPSVDDDSSGSSNRVNPVQAGMTYFIPAEDKAFRLDDQTGREQIHVVASRERLPELENQYAALLEARQAQDHTQLAKLQNQLQNILRRIQPDIVQVLNFNHLARGEHAI